MFEKTLRLKSFGYMYEKTLRLKSFGLYVLKDIRAKILRDILKTFLLDLKSVPHRFQNLKD